MKGFKLIGLVVLVVFIVVFAAWCDVKVWRLKHPQAPAWTYFF